MSRQSLTFLCLGTLGFGFVCKAPAQESGHVPAFAAQTEIITVDAVVLDKEGRPVRGLSQADFSVWEDGKPQEVVAFEARDLGASRPTDARAAVGLPDSDEDASDTPGRTLAFIFDDTGLDARCVAAIEGIRKWVREAADPRDDLTLVTTSGAVSVQGAIGNGRGAILRELERIRCRRPQPAFFTSPGLSASSGSSEQSWTEWEAYEAVSRGRGDAVAQMVVGWWRERARAIVSAIETFSREQGERRGRKASFVFTQGFIRDEDLKLADQAIDAAQRANVALYFVDPRGLIAGGGAFPDSGFEATHQIDLAGADEMARETGGAILRSNDLEGSLLRAVDESAAYYLLGYAPARAADGTWRKVQVRVARKDVSVRARRGYYASTEPLSEERLRAARATPRPDTPGTGGRASATARSVSPARTSAPAPRSGPVSTPGAARASASAPSGEVAPTGAHDNAPPLGPAAATVAQVEAPSATAPGTAQSPTTTSAQPATATSADPAPTSGAKVQQPMPEFPTLAEAITVDVVVLDKSGKPLGGLSPADFRLFEDGRPQPIVGFEPRSLAARKAEEDWETETKNARVASNETKTGLAGRRLAFLVDDLGIEPSHMLSASQALSQWLAKGADPRDEVTLTSSSGDAWWSDTVGEGREDFEAVLRRMVGKKRFASSHEAMSDWESYHIDTRESAIDEPIQMSGPPSASGGCVSTSPHRTLLDRVVDRWFGTGACSCDTNDVGRSISFCRTQARGRAREVYSTATRRAVALLASVERMSRGVGPHKGRKSIVILSEGFLRDADQRAFERAVDASRRGNTSVSFVDVRGLVSQSFYGADQGRAPQPGDVGVLTAEIALAETAGAEYLAETTGGSVARDTNDIAGAVARLADESSTYYLLGYQTDRPLDGKWRKLQVKVAAPGVTVRARPGYFATAAAAPLEVATQPAKDKKKPKNGVKGEKALPVRTLDPGLFAGGGRDEIPLRIAPHVFETDQAGKVRVLVAVEVHTEGLTFGGSGKELTAKLDVTILGVSRDQSALVPVDSRVELSIDQATVGGWWIFSRELRLPSGPAQVRALVRDVASGRSGLVVKRIEIPASGTPYLSTPILTNALSKTSTDRPTVLAVAHRTFPQQGNLYCAYEVYVAPGRDLTAIPDVRSTYTLSDDNGQVVASPAPTPIDIALGGQLVRLHAIPLEDLEPGRYELSIHATDWKHGLDLGTTEVFRIEPSDSR